MKKLLIKSFVAKRIAVAVAAACAIMPMPAFAADDMKVLMDLLLKKGVITQQDYDQNIKAAEDAAENKAFKEQRLDSDVTKTNKYIEKHAKDGSVKSTGLGWVSEDGKNELNVTGRLHFDARSFSKNFGETTDRDSSSMGDRFSVRRARLGVNGILNKDISYELVTNLTGSNANAANSTTSTSFLDTGWANFAVNPALQVRVGKFKQPYGLETLTSSNNIDFMERSYQDQIAPGKQLGAMLHGESANGIVYGLSAYQKDFDPASNSMGSGPEAAARLAMNFAKMFNAGDDVLVHVGFAGTTGRQQFVPTTSSQSGGNLETKGAFVSFNDENGGLKNIYRTRLLGTPPCKSPAATLNGACTYGGYALPAADAANVDKSLMGFELATAYGPTKLQYEYTDAKYDASSQKYVAPNYTSTSSSGSVKVSYVELIHNITGESWASTYKNGVMGAIKPKSNFKFSDMSGTGAWQVGVRLSKYDASSLGSNANGKETAIASGGATVEGSPVGKTLTYGLTWFLNPNARVMLNYSVSKFDTAFRAVDVQGPTAHSADVLGNSEKIISLRSQFNF